MKTVIIFFLLVSCATIALAQPPDTLWTRVFGGSFGGNAFNSVQETDDGGLVLAGKYGSGGTDFFLVKLDSAGNSLWTRRIGNASDEAAFASQQTSDGGYILAGSRITDGWLVKTNAQGDSLWSRMFGGAQTDQLYAVRQTSDHGYVVTGYWSDGAPDWADVFLAKVDSNGNPVWSHTYGDAGDEIAMDLEVTSDGGYVLAGTSLLPGGEQSAAYLLRTDAAGDTLWTREFGPNGINRFRAVKETPDGGFILAGATATSLDAPPDGYVVKTDAAGNAQWARIIGGWGGQFLAAVQQTDDGGYMAAGSTGNLNTGPCDFYLVKMNANGDTLWTRSYNRGNLDYATSALVTRDRGYVIAGWMTPQSSNPWCFVLRTASDAATPPPRAEISVVPSLVDFSSVFVGDSTNLPITIGSTGDTDLLVSNIAVPQDIHTDFVAPQTLAPGESLVVNVTFAPTEAREYVDTLLVHSNAPDSIVAVRVTGTGATNASRERNQMPQTYALSVYPNPFNAVAEIRFDLPKASQVSLRVYDLLGQEVAVLVNGLAPAGSHRLSFDASPHPSGTYLCRFEAGSYSAAQRLMLIR